MNDTAFGINNEGGLSFDYYHEDHDQVDGANVYNGQLSTLWVNFRQAFPDLIQETYQDLRNNSVLNYEELIDQFITKGSDKWSESIYNEDGDFKYISMLRSNNDATNLPQVRGTGEEHLRYFIENRLNYCDSKWYAGEYISRPNPNNTSENINNFITLRIYTPVDENGLPRTDLVVPASADITLTPYSHMYGGVRYKANGTLLQHRLEANETYTFDAPNEVFNDTETAIYGAPQLSSLGDLAPLYLGYIDVGAATKLVELKIGDSTPGYQNSNLYHLAVGTNRLLKKIDIQNCIGFNQALVLTECPNIEEVYAKGSGITGVDLPDSGYLKVLQLPSTITNLTLKNQFYIEDLTIEGYTRLKTITIENCPDIDSLSILDLATNVERVRLTNVDWHYDDASLLYELIDRNIGGINENGINTDTMWVDGKCHIECLTGTELAEIKNLYPYLEITYTTLESQLIFMKESGQIDFVDTIPKIGVDESITTGNGSIKSNPGCFVTELYDLCRTLTSSSDRCNIVYYIPITSEDIGDAVPTIQFYNNNTDECITYNYQIKDKQEQNNTGITGQLGAVNKVRFTIAKSCADVSYAYCQDTGDVLFAGKNTPYYGMKNINDNPILYIQTIFNGGNGTDPVADGAIPAPTKESTAQYYHNFNGWSLEPCGSANPNALLNVEADRYVYAAFTNEIRSYTVNFYNGATLLYSTVVEYGSDATYVGSTPANNSTGDISDFEFYGWSPSPTNIQGNTNCYAQFHDLREITDSWATIAANVANGTATEKYAIGAFKTLNIGEMVLPYNFKNGSAVMYNNEIHILGGSDNSKKHYKYDGAQWIEVGNLPYDFYDACAIIYNNEIHILGSSASNYRQLHYKYDGSTWTRVSTLPYNFYRGTAVVYNDEIHILGGFGNNTKHYRYDGTQWIEVETLTFGIIWSAAVIYNDELHIMGGTSNNTAHYKWNGTEWIKVGNLPYPMTEGNSVVYANEIHILGSGSAANSVYRCKHCKWNGNSWTEVSTLPEDLTIEGSVVVYNDAIYMLQYKSFLYFAEEESKWKRHCTESIPMEIIAHNHDELADGIRKWESVSKPKYSTGNHATLVYNNELHVLKDTEHYKWDGVEWASVSTLPANIEGGAAVVYNNELHLITNKSLNHYKWDGSEWITVSTLPYTCNCSSAVVYADCIHIIGGHSADLNHYKWDGTEWTSVSTLPYRVVNNALVSYNDELHMFGGQAEQTSHYKWDGVEWTSVSILPYNFVSGLALVYDNEIHIMAGNYGAKSHYKFSDSEWVDCGVIPINMHSAGDATVYNGEIHAIRSDFHFKWSGASWVEQPYEFKPYNNWSCCVIHKNELHIIGGYSNSTGHYKTDGVTKTDIGSTPISFTGAVGVSYNGEIHVFSSSVYYKWNETDGWVENGSLPFTYNSNSCRFFIYNNEIHAYSSTNHYKFNGTDWEEVSTIPRSVPVVYILNNELYNINYAGGTFEFYKFDGSEWDRINANASVTNSQFWSYIKLSIEYKGVSYAVYNKCMFKFDGINLTEINLTQDVGNNGGIGVIDCHLVTWGGYFLHRYENPRATLTFLAKNLLKDSRTMGAPTKYINEWRTSYTREWLNDTLLTMFPTDLQNEISKVNKMSDHKDSSDNYLVKTEDSIWIPSVEEVGLTHSEYIAGQGEIYPIFTNDASRIRTKLDSNEATDWWLRSNRSGIQTYGIEYRGWLAYWETSVRESGILPGFCI